MAINVVSSCEKQMKIDDQGKGLNFNLGNVPLF